MLLRSDSPCRLSPNILARTYPGGAQNRVVGSLEMPPNVVEAVLKTPPNVVEAELKTLPNVVVGRFGVLHDNE